MKCLGGLFIIPASSLTMGSPRLTGFAESFQAKVVSVSEPVAMSFSFNASLLEEKQDIKPHD